MDITLMTLKIKVIKVKDLEGLEESKENSKLISSKNEESSRPQYEFPSKSPSIISNNLQKEINDKRNNSEIKNENNAYEFQPEEARFKQKNDQSRDEELYGIVEKSLNENDDFQHSFDFEIINNQEAGGAHKMTEEETKTKFQPMEEDPIKNQNFHYAKETTEKDLDEEQTQDLMAKTLNDHSGQRIETGVVNIGGNHKIPTLTAKNKIRPEVIELSKTPTSGIEEAAKTIVDSEQK